MQRTVFKDLLRISLPLMIGSFFQMLYNLTDAYFLGKLGKEALSAPSIVMTLIMFLVLFGIGLSAAGTTLISQAKGKGDQEKIDFYLGQTTIVLLLVAFFIMAVGFTMAKPLLKLLQTPDEILPYVLDYMVIILTGIPLMFGFFVLHGAMQGIGNTKTPLKIQLVTVIINVLLDPILIFGLLGFPRLEVKGAAIATVSARGIASIIAFIVLFRGKHGLTLKRKHLTPNKEALLLLLRVGLPSALGRSVASLGFVVLQGIVNSFGASVIAAFGVGMRVINLFNMPSMSMSMGTAALVGQSLGAKDHERTSHIISVSIKTVLGFIVPAMALTFLWGNLVTRFFIADPDVIYHGTMLFRIVSVSVIFFGLFSVISGTLQGAGDTKPLMVLQILRIWGFRVPGAYLLSTVFAFGPPGIWFGLFLSNIICFALGLLWLRRGSWKTAINVDAI
jgi:putative MATE family efflux protein